MKVEILGVLMMEHPRDIWSYILSVCCFIVCSQKFLPGIYKRFQGSSMKGRALIHAKFFLLVVLTFFLKWACSTEGRIIEEVTRFISIVTGAVWITFIFFLISPWWRKIVIPADAEYPA